jgi:hypothetical protein
MREPFTSLLSRNERLLAAGEGEPGITTGPLAGFAEILALFSFLPAVVLVVRLDGVPLKVAGAVLPPLLMILLARYPLRRWRRPREWVGVTDHRVLVWRRKGGIRAEPRIDEIPLREVEGIELNQDDWDRRNGTHQLTLHGAAAVRDLARLHNAERLRDAVLAAVPAASTPPPAAPAAPATPADFLPPPPPPGDYRP